MQQTVDTDRLGGLTSLDLSRPPMKEIGLIEYPRMVYKHPKDKTKEHKIRVCETKSELDQALKEGYNLKPHVPQPAAESEDDE